MRCANVSDFAPVPIVGTVKQAKQMFICSKKQLYLNTKNDYNLRHSRKKSGDFYKVYRFQEHFKKSAKSEDFAQRGVIIKNVSSSVFCVVKRNKKCIENRF